MAFFKKKTKSHKEAATPKRQERLVGIRRSIEASLKYEQDALSRPINASTLKRIYNVDSLWIKKGDDIRKIGSANYDRELSVFRAACEQYSGLKNICLQKGNTKYYVVEKEGITYAFSTPVEFMNPDIYMMLTDIMGSFEENKVFLSSNTNITGE